MTNREEFEKVIDSIELNDEMKKIIDELKNDLEDCTIRKLSTEQEIERLKADNPDVDCPECHNHENPEMICIFCMEKGTVSTVKALQYEIEQLRGELYSLKNHHIG